MPDSAETYLDLRGLKCPLPVLRTRKLLAGLAVGARALVECTDPLSVIDIPHLVRLRGDLLEESCEKDGVYLFRIRRQASDEAQDQTQDHQRQDIAAGGRHGAKRLAAVVFDKSEAINQTMADFAARLAARGTRISGIVQVSAKEVSAKEVSAHAQGSDRIETHVRDLTSGRRIPVLQNLGPQSRACRADSAALAEIAAIVRQARLAGPDVIFVNRFGRLEAEGGGLREEIGAAVAAGIPVVIGVSVKYIEAWRSFAQDVGTEIACELAALEDWWRRLEGTAVPL